jgi:iron complex outermembrane receptor protein
MAAAVPGVLALAVAGAPAVAQQPAEPPLVLIQGVAEGAADALAFARVSSSDTAAILPGADAAQGGAVAGQPVLHGFGDDRVRTLVDGVPVTAACPMHMNPALSYIDPSGIARMTVLPGVTPVSLGGDSIGGTILVDSAAPRFAPDAEPRFDGSLASFYRSNGSAAGVDLAATLAGRDSSFGYQASGLRAGDYQDGNGERIRASRVETSSQEITFALRTGSGVTEVQAGVQDIPYEGFPNADMDLTGNIAAFLNLRYRGTTGAGELRIAGYFDTIDHRMNGNAPDRYPPTPVDITSMGDMPTREHGQDFGYRVELDSTRSARDVLRIGNELHVEQLDDRWPGAPLGMPFDYVSLNHATRGQLGTFAEWERRWNARWTTLAGVRNDTVWSHAGPVQGYDGLDPLATAFNAGDRARTDFDFDATLLARYQGEDGTSYRFGLARKERAPNLYERYAWGESTMGMITWFGDGNGYTGDPHLLPETAYTLSASGEWHDAAAAPRWQAQLTPYYTVVQNYIGVETLCAPACSGMPAVQLQFANQRARLYGLDASGGWTLAQSARLGTLELLGTAGFVRGEDPVTATNLYHMMPLNGTLALAYTHRAWLGRLELRVVSRKDDVDVSRLEPQTAGYALLNLRAAYLWGAARFDLAVMNLLDRQYASPLGGSWQSALYPPGTTGSFLPLPSPGRSLDAAVSVKF